MKFLQCLICEGELDIIGEDSFLKKVKCQDCGFTSIEKNRKKEPEIIKRRTFRE